METKCDHKKVVKDYFRTLSLRKAGKKNNICYERVRQILVNHGWEGITSLLHRLKSLSKPRYYGPVFCKKCKIPFKKKIRRGSSGLCISCYKKKRYQRPDVKESYKQWAKKYFQKNKEKIQEKNRKNLKKYYLRHREKLKRDHKKYREEHREHFRMLYRKYYWKNREKISLAKKAYYLKHRQEIKKRSITNFK